MSNEFKSNKEELRALIRSSLQKDEELRELYQIKDKFRFIRDRLNALLSRVEENLATLAMQEEKKTTQISEDETLVYVYLFNAQGMVLQTWLKMINPTVYYEYSVNRPVYTEKEDVEALIRTKSNKHQHGYLTIIVKKSDLLTSLEKQKDSLGNSLIKVREGALHPEQLLSLTHNGVEFILEDGSLIKKES